MALKTLNMQGPLIDALQKQGIINEEQILQFMKIAEQQQKTLEEILSENNIISDENLLKIKSEIYNLPFFVLSPEPLAKEALHIIPSKIAENYQVVALQKEGGNLKVGIVDPQNYKAIEAIDFLANDENLHVEYFIISLSDFNKAFSQYGELKTEAEKVLAGVEEIGIPVDASAEQQVGIIKSAPVSKMVLVIIRHAIDGRASDIHIEPETKETRIRYRVDGILHTSLILPKYIHASIVARIKVLANLKLDETRKPQDGRIRLNINDRDIDFRVSTLPLFEGEKVVMRVLDSQSTDLTLDKLGFLEEHREMILESIKKTYGTLLVTGPTGSGKTTTLYTALGMLNKEGVNIITLEDPIEYYLDGINQSQVNPEVGYSFASGLRSILRQDPNIIMLGEIRDHETAELVVHASLTGHLVLTTLHTNNSIGAVPRLLDMGIEPFLLSSTINAVIAQRLARKICVDCREEAPIPDDVRKKIEKEILDIASRYREEMKLKSPFKFYKGKGCSACGDKGYRGRLVVAEVLKFTPELQDTVAHGFHADHVNEELKKQNFITLRQDSLLKAAAGFTTLEEVFRVTQL